MDEFEHFARLRERATVARRVDRVDGGLTVRACPNGHRTRVLGLVSIVFENHEEIARTAARWTEADACATCGAPTRVEARLHATYLPVANEDLLLHVSPNGPVRLARLTASGEILPVTGDEQLLREVGPASRARGILFGLAAGAPRPGVADADALVRQDPDYAPAHLARGKVLRAARDVEGAAAAYARAVALWPEGAEARFLLADALDDLRLDERALREYDEAARLDPDDPEVHVQRGIVLKRVGRRDEAWAAYERALALDPHHVTTLFSVAVWHAQQDDLARAVDAIEEARPSDLTKHPGRDTAFDILTQRAMALVAERKWIAADRCLEIAAAFRTDAKVLFNRAVCLTNAGAHGEALRLARAAVDADRTYANGPALVAQLEPIVAQGVREDLVSLRNRRNIRYVDSWGNVATMLNFIVKGEGTTMLLEIEASRLTLERERDLVRLLVAKGHNASLAAPAPTKKGLFDGVLSKTGFGGDKAAPPASTGRPFVFVTEEKPDPAFLALAGARRWRTPDGRVVESAPVQVFLETPQGRSIVPPPKEDEPTLPRRPQIETERATERFYPKAYADYD